LRAGTADRAGETEEGEVGCAGYSDLGVGGDEGLLRGLDVGTALKQGRGQIGGNVWGKGLLCEAAAARDIAGVLPKQ